MTPPSVPLLPVSSALSASDLHFRDAGVDRVEIRRAGRETSRRLSGCGMPSGTLTPRSSPSDPPTSSGRAVKGSARIPLRRWPMPQRSRPSPEGRGDEGLWPFRRPLQEFSVVARRRVLNTPRQPCSPLPRDWCVASPSCLCPLPCSWLWPSGLPPRPRRPRGRSPSQRPPCPRPIRWPTRPCLPVKPIN